MNTKVAEHTIDRGIINRVWQSGDLRHGGALSGYIRRKL